MYDNLVSFLFPIDISFTRESIKYTDKGSVWFDWAQYERRSRLITRGFRVMVF
jgi:hypothetical protein